MRSRARAAAALMGALALTAGLIPAAHAADPTLSSEVVQSGLSIPWDIAFTSDGKMLVTERGGTVRVYASGEPGAALLRTNTIGYVHAEGEAGLMGIAVDRNYATNQRVYVCASRNDYGRWLNQVLRYRLDQWNRLMFEGFVIRYGMAAGVRHNGCAVEMFSDGMVWVTMGDAGNMALAQNPNSYNGKVLRVTPTGGIPPTNPIISGRRSLIFSMGHRNPQGIAIDPGSGAVYAVEHGPDRNDEVNRIMAGKNYGWPCYTGSGQRYTPYAGPCSPASAYYNPRWSSGSTTWATSNGVFLMTPNWGDWNGHFIVATLKEQDLRHFVPTPLGSTSAMMIWDGQPWLNDTFRKRAVVRGPGNTLYFTTSNGGGADQIIRVTPS